MEVIAFSIIPATNPCLAGHFPDNPVVPGVVILEEVMKSIRQHQQIGCVQTIDSVKFLAPLLPDTQFQIACTYVADKIRFECRADNCLLVSGQMQFSTS